jgi:hypothetical protein
MITMHRMTKAGVLLETLLLLAGLGLLVESFMSGTATYKLLNAGQAVEGLITGVDNYGFSIFVQFTPSEGEPRVIQQDGFVFEYKMGEQVPVIYDPANPAAAAVNDFGVLWFETICFGLGGFIAFVIGLRLRVGRSI